MINYGILDEAIHWYQSEGFDRIEGPWLVSEYADCATKPENVPSFKVEHNQKCLVASGEQSFLELNMKRYLPSGAFQVTTPCFRYEKRDALHCKTFMKTELIITDVVIHRELERMINVALTFFKRYIPGCKIVKTDIGYDIEIDGFELGSYGFREVDGFKYIYGTGVAEPRFSRLIEKYGQKEDGL